METILLSLAAIYDADPGVRLTAEQLFRGMASSSVPPTDEESRAALAELIDRRLAAAEDDSLPMGLVPQKVYRITTDGLDFKRHRFPWDLVDRFAARRGGE